MAVEYTLDMERGILNIGDSGYSFATKFLKSGMDLGYIQELLAYKNCRTTEVYTCVNKTNLAKIENPLDRLMKEK